MVFQVLGESAEDFVSSEILAVAYVCLFAFAIRGLWSRSVSFANDVPVFAYLVVASSFLRCIYFGLPPAAVVHTDHSFTPHNFAKWSPAFW